MDLLSAVRFSDLHLEIGIAAMETLLRSGEKVMRLRYSPFVTGCPCRNPVDSVDLTA